MTGSVTYELLGGGRHRHAGGLEHVHPHDGPHTHRDVDHTDDGHQHHHTHAAHGHSHGLVDASIKRSREGIRAVALALTVLARPPSRKR